MDNIEFNFLARGQFFLTVFKIIPCYEVFFGNLTFAMIARMFCGNHVKNFMLMRTRFSSPDRELFFRHSLGTLCKRCAIFLQISCNTFLSPRFSLPVTVSLSLIPSSASDASQVYFPPPYSLRITSLSLGKLESELMDFKQALGVLYNDMQVV